MTRTSLRRIRNRVASIAAAATVFLAPHAPTVNAGVASTKPPAGRHRVPVIDVTDLYHPPQDPGDNFDLLAAYALPEVDLRAVILDCTEAFRKPVADDPRPGLFADAHGPRDPGFIPVLQLNYLFGRAVPCAAGPFGPMRSLDDPMRDVPAFQQQGVELLLETLRRSPEPVQIVSFGSVRPIAVALNRDPKLMHAKVARVLVCAGSASPGVLEWNVALDPRAFARLLRSDLPVALYPCATKEGAFVASSQNTYWQMSDLKFIRQMEPRLQAYLDFAFGCVQRSDFLRVLDEGFAREFNADVYAQPFNVWETAVWQEITGRLLVQRVDGACRLVRPAEEQAGDRIIRQGLVPCSWQASEDGKLEVKLGKGKGWIYQRDDPAEVQRALREAVPALYRTFSTISPP